MGFSHSRRAAVLWLIFALVGQTTAASAQLTERDRAAARTMMAEGRSARERKDLAAALESFRAADDLMHFPTTGLEVGRAEMDLDKLLDARTTLARIIALPAQPGDPPVFAKAKAEAEQLLTDVERRTPRLHVVTEGAPVGTEPVVTIDGRRVALGSAGVEELLDPGAHVVVASVDWGEAREQLTLQDGESRELSLSLPPKPAPPKPPSIAPTRERPAADTRATNSTLVYVGFGAAAAGVVAGTVTGLVSIADTKAAEGGCHDGACPPPTHGDLHGAEGFAIASDVSFAVAAIGLGLGVFGLIPRSRPPTSAAPTVRVTPAARGAWVTVSF